MQGTIASDFNWLFETDRLIVSFFIQKSVIFR